MECKPGAKEQENRTMRKEYVNGEKVMSRSEPAEKQDVISALQSLVSACEQARIDAGKVDQENGHTARPGKLYPANQAVCHATQQALDNARFVLAVLSDGGLGHVIREN